MAVTKKQIKEALEKNDGLILQSAKALGVTRQALSRRIHKSNELEEYLEEVKESSLDIAESALYRAIRNGEAWAICFKLKCHGKQRGFIERQEFDVRGKGDLAVNLSENEKAILKDISREFAKRIIIVSNEQIGGTIEARS